MCLYEWKQIFCFDLKNKTKQTFIPGKARVDAEVLPWSAGARRLLWTCAGFKGKESGSPCGGSLLGGGGGAAAAAAAAALQAGLYYPLG